MPKTAVVALGGNTTSRSRQTGSFEEQSDNGLTMARCVRAIRRPGWDIVVAHGLQVGNLAIHQAEGHRLMPKKPLLSLGALTHDDVGRLISIAMRERVVITSPEFSARTLELTGCTRRSAGVAGRAPASALTEPRGARHDR